MTRPSPQPIYLEPVAQLHQQWLVVAQIEAVSQSVEGVCRKAVLAVTAAAVDHVQVGQRRQFVAVADLEAEVAHAEVLDRFVAGHCVARGVHAPGLPRARVDRQRLQLHPQLLAAADVPVETCVEMPLTALEAADQVVVLPDQPVGRAVGIEAGVEAERVADEIGRLELDRIADLVVAREPAADRIHLEVVDPVALARPVVLERGVEVRSEEHTSELQSLMRLSYAVFCLKKKKTTLNHKTTTS